MSNLLRQTRPARAGDEGVSASNEPVAAAATRQSNRGAIDSTGSGTAGIAAALTIYLSPLGRQAEQPGDKRQARAVPASGGGGARTSAADVLRVLDSYAKDPLRLSA